MRKNTQEVIAAWQAGKYLRRCESIWTDGEYIMSYETCLLAPWWADPVGGEIRTEDGENVWLLNLTDYSITTRIHQNSLFDLNILGCRLYDVPQGSPGLTDSADKALTHPIALPI